MVYPGTNPETEGKTCHSRNFFSWDRKSRYSGVLDRVTDFFLKTIYLLTCVRQLRPETCLFPEKRRKEFNDPIT